MFSKYNLMPWLIFGFAIFFMASLEVQEKKSEIIFLNFVWEKGKIVLKDFAIRPGHVKEHSALKANQEILIYELYSINNTIISSGFLPNPSIERLEYADPESHGKIKLVVVKRDTAAFTLRLPYTRDLARVDFFKLKETRGVQIAKTQEELTSLKGNKIASVTLKSAKRR